MKANYPLSNFNSISAVYLKRLGKLGIATLEDLIYYPPSKYQDFSKISKISQLKPDENVTIFAQIENISSIRLRFGKFLTKAIVSDSGGKLEIIWFNQPYLGKILNKNDLISISGKVSVNQAKLQLISPAFEKMDNFGLKNHDFLLHTARIIAVYPETKGVSSKWLRTKIASFLDIYLQFETDFLPKNIKKAKKLIDLNDALNWLHFPQNLDQIEKARRRLAFDELFLIQLAAQLRKNDWKQGETAPEIKIKSKQIEKFLKNLPFKLTQAQKKSVNEILADLEKSVPANRLLEGDVGSGKTVVAALAIYAVHLAGFLSIFAAPTEVLAFQHQKTLERILSKFDISVGIWTKSKKIKADVICGTHALISSLEVDKQVGLIVIDEQQRFGVAQRAKMIFNFEKKYRPHLLTMTATPIPRTLALTLYGDLDLSILDSLPEGRQKIDTFVVPQTKREAAYKFIEKQIANGNQAFIITPLIELSESLNTIRAAKEEFAKLQKVFGPNIKMGLLHGRLKSKEKEDIMTKFKNNKIQILVSTPIVEVGIDIANATVMMIESADRFGLAQLHQLRGRVGRGKYKSYCLLFTDSQSSQSIKRLKSLEIIDNGPALAEIDLKYRGPGEVYGFKQSGYINLKFANFFDHKQIINAQSEAKKIVLDKNFSQKYPLLFAKLKSLQFDFVHPN